MSAALPVLRSARLDAHCGFGHYAALTRASSGQTFKSRTKGQSKFRMPRNTIIVLLIAAALSGACTGHDAGPAPEAASPAASAPAAETAAPPLAVAEGMIRRVATQDGCRDFTAEMRLTGEAEDGRPVQLDFRVQRKYEGPQTSTLLVVTAPREETEKALLAVEKQDQPTEAISYLAGLRKIARFKSNSTRDLRGAKISVQELLGLELNKYTPASTLRVIDGSDSLLRVSLREKPDTELAYPRIEAFFREANQQPVRFELFDAQNKLARVVRVEAVRPIQNYQTITRVEIEDKNTSRKVRLEALKVKYDQKLSDSLFTEAHLTRLISEASRRLIQ